MRIFRKVTVLAIPTLCAAALLTHAAPVQAQSRARLCENYAHSVADRNAHTDVIGSTIMGAGLGAIVGGISRGNSRGVGRGAAIGGGVGLVAGAAGRSSNYQRVFNRAFQDCMDDR
jgi:outer membrane lipoprotein SlyB